MAWNQPGGSKNPWGRRPGQGGTALDEKVKNWQQKVEALLRLRGPTADSGGSLLATVVIVAIALWLGSGFFEVGAAERGVIQRFGALVEVRQQGWGWRWPWPIETIRKVNVMNVASKEYPQRVLTSDVSLVELRLAVQYRLADPLKILFQVRDPEETLQEVTESAIREVVGRSTLEDVLAGGTRASLTQRAKQLIQRTLDEYNTGIEVTTLNLTDVQVPDAVVPSQRDANKALADQERAIKEAQAYASGVVPSAQGDAAKILQDAAAYKARAIALAEGKTALFTQVAAAYERAPQVTRERLYLETMEDIFARANKVIIEPKTGAGGNVLYLPLDKIMGHSPAGSESQPMSGAPGALPNDTETVTVEGRSRGER
ncbi:MAG TPA: FtsH protease activity modulator HflK [Steroidobacteraceae bacterium]|nr:FtsH protease activity modulator HflK [Steroidobacteraceae bacterium]